MTSPHRDRCLVLVPVLACGKRSAGPPSLQTRVALVAVDHYLRLSARVGNRDLKPLRLPRSYPRAPSCGTGLQNLSSCRPFHLCRSFRRFSLSPFRNARQSTPQPGFAGTRDPQVSG